MRDDRRQRDDEDRRADSERRTHPAVHGPARLSGGASRLRGFRSASDGVASVLRALRAALHSPNRNARSAVVIGRLLGIAFVICFATGVYSHFLQDPLPGMRFPTSPRSLYAFTQGLHITAGIAIIPLLFAKLNTVLPSLLQMPPVRNVLHLLERASIAVFVGGALVQVFTGLVNTFQWYPWPFPFRQTHYAMAYVLIGSLAVHIGVKLRIIVRYWRRRDSVDADGRFIPDRTVGSELLPDSDRAVVEPSRDDARDRGRSLVRRVERWIDDERQPVVPRQRATESGRLARRGFLAAIASGVAGVVVLTVGQSNALAQPLNVFAPRQRGLGPNGLPINRTAHAAGVLDTARAADWALTVSAHGVRKRFSRTDLRALGLVTVQLPIACVEGWSQMATWRGVRLRDLITAVGAPPDSRLKITSLEQHGAYRIMEMGPEYAADPTTVVALELNGEDLDIDHGYPARIMAPGRPGVLQTKWLASIEVMA
ncbi:molybdopterin-dependent oxidoreductase [Curtobacterium ammoniigenes]|uniref:molybdopterin-dependent oxidoreductase n=1 Tax=Curtobacterium ammoniigenes TaxID=395387 RepID=UPI001FE12147|nr:molybdopterin-dependent oxidoreductase [Curtobacterium ammoniigenes]